MRIALIGNQNSGKTTFFNYLTGSYQKVGNFPGITVEMKYGKLKHFPEIEIVDLPGVYSLDNYSEEEKETINFLKNNQVDYIINIIDGTCLSRHLLLTKELLKLNTKVILCISFFDEMTTQQKENLQKLEREEQISLFLIDYRNKKLIDDFYSKLHNKNENKKELNLSLLENEDVRIKNDLDRVFLNRFLAYPLMILIFSLILFLSFYVGGNILGNAISSFFDYLIGFLNNFFIRINLNIIITSLLLEGIIPALGTLLSLAPTLLILFFCISLLEDSGYLSRVAALMDRLLRPLGLSGRSFVCLILGYGCTVSGVLASKILTDKEEKKLVLKLVPYSICPARMMILLAVLPLLFHEYAFFALLLIYLLANSIMILMSFIFRMKKKNKVPYFILELPKYRFPSFKNAFYLVEEKLKDYIARAFNIILISTVFIWFLSSFDYKMNFLLEDRNTSLLSILGNSISFIWLPFNFPEPYKVTSSLIIGLISKESFLSTMVILYGSLENIINLFTSENLIALIVFVMLYMPCIAVFSVVKKENKSFIKTFLIFTLETLIAYLVSILIYFILMLI